MTEDPTKSRHEGVMLGLLLASYICECAAGHKSASPVSMRIMNFRTAYDHAKQNGDDVPDFRGFAV